MIAVKIGPPICLATVAAPHYFQKRSLPEYPDDLDNHACLALRFHAHAPIYDWEFEKDGEELVKKVSDPFIFRESDIEI